MRAAAPAPSKVAGHAAGVIEFSSTFGLPGEDGAVKRRPSRILRLACTLAILCLMTGAVSSVVLAQDQIAPLNVKEGEKAPDFALQDGNGKTVRLSDYRGHAVLLDFFRGYW